MCCCPTHHHLAMLLSWLLSSGMMSRNHYLLRLIRSIILLAPNLLFLQVQSCEDNKDKCHCKLNMLGLAKRVGARILQTATSECSYKIRIETSKQVNNNNNIGNLRAKLLPSHYGAQVGYDLSSSSSTNQNAGRGYTGRIVSGMQRVAAIERAEKLRRDLKSHHHSFVKPMVRSHVSGCFWLGLPRSFCVDILPPTDLRMILEDVKGKEHNVLYLGRKNGLSGGWRGFAMDHNLEDGDAIVFELSQPARFKVHIVKAIEEEARESDEAKDGVNATGKTEKSKLKKDGATAAAKTEKSRLKKKDQPVLQKRPGSPKKGGRPAKRARQ